MTKSYKIILLLIVLVLVNSVQIKKQTKCRALVLEGGGDLGSYQIGVLKAFADNLPAEEIRYDVITGVSVGSINAMGLVLHEMGNEKAAIDWMVALWSVITKDNIYNSWFFGTAQGLFFEEGIFNNEIEYEFLNKTFRSIPNAKISRRFNVNTVDIDTGKLYKFNETMTLDEIAIAVKASSAMPLTFTHTHYQNHTYIDGGSIWNIDLSGAIDRCLEVVDSYADVIVDVVMCSGPFNVTDFDASTATTVANYYRYKSINAFYGKMSDFEETMRGYPDVTFRYVAWPQEKLPRAPIPLVFNHTNMVEMIQIGIKEGKAVIEGKTETIGEMVNRFSKQTWLGH